MNQENDRRAPDRQRPSNTQASGKSGANDELVGGYDLGTSRTDREDETAAAVPQRGPNNPRMESGNTRRETEPGYQDHKHESGEIPPS